MLGQSVIFSIWKLICMFFFFFFKQKTAYEIKCDWSSDVCSSDLMHDANHGGTSSSARMNGILSFTLDLIGGSSFLWRRKHNVLHHTYTNISALDPDLEGGGPFLRLAPWQSRHGHHRFQHLYVWLLYGLFPLKWW